MTINGAQFCSKICWTTWNETQHKFVTNNHSKEGAGGEGIYWWNTPDTESRSKIELEIQFPSRKMWDGIALLRTAEISASHASYLYFLCLVFLWCLSYFPQWASRNQGVVLECPSSLSRYVRKRHVKYLARGFQQASGKADVQHIQQDISHGGFLSVVCVCRTHRVPPPLQGETQQGLNGICALAKFQLFHTPSKKGWEERRGGRTQLTSFPLGSK